MEDATNETSFVFLEKLVQNEIPLITLKPIADRLKHHLLVIYGGSVKKDFRFVIKNFLGETLAHLGFTVHCFDFRSNLSQNNFYDFGLYDRIQDTRAVVDHLKKKELQLGDKLSILGVSMGGHIAVEIAAEEGKNIENLFLIAPAAYHHAACQPGVKFGEQFKELTTKFGMETMEFLNSEILTEKALLIESRYLIIAFGEDYIVGDVPKFYQICLNGIGGSRFYEYENFGHNGNFEDPRKIALISRHITEFTLEFA